MRDIYIIGSGGFAKEVYLLIGQINAANGEKRYNIAGFIDLNESTLLIGRSELPVLRQEDFLSVSPDCCLAVGIGSPKILRRLHSIFGDRFDFPNLIHPTASGLWSSVKLGVGNIITHGCSLTVDISFGAFNIVNLNTTIGHDSTIGSFNVINPGANISGDVKIGDGNLIGTNATILQGLEIANNSILGAGALMTKSLESNLVAVGSPAKAIKSNE